MLLIVTLACHPRPATYQSACSLDSDCAAPFECLGGMCTLRCDSDDDCPVVSRDCGDPDCVQRDSGTVCFVAFCH